MDARTAASLFHRNRCKTARTTRNERISDFHPALRTIANFELLLLFTCSRHTLKFQISNCKWHTNSIMKMIWISIVMICLSFEYGCVRFHYMSICETIPPMTNAPTHVLNQIMSASFTPRSFSITINDATQGTKSVIVTSATTT